MDSLLSAECLSTFCDTFYGMDELGYNTVFVGEFEDTETSSFNNNIDFNESVQYVPDWNHDMQSSNTPCDVNERNVGTIDSAASYPHQKKHTDAMQGQTTVNTNYLSFQQAQPHPQSSVTELGDVDFQNPEFCTDFACGPSYANLNNNSGCAQDAEHAPFLNVYGNCDPSILTLCSENRYDSDAATAAAFPGEWNNYYRSSSTQPPSPVQSTRQQPDFGRRFAFAPGVGQITADHGGGDGHAKMPFYRQGGDQSGFSRHREGGLVPVDEVPAGASDSVMNNARAVVVNSSGGASSSSAYSAANGCHRETAPSSLNSGSRSESPPKNSYVFSAGLNNSYAAQPPFSPSYYNSNNNNNAKSSHSSDRHTSPEWSNAMQISSSPFASSHPYASMCTKKRSRVGAHHTIDRERRVRPKVIAEKGALQCRGINRKKGSRCRNAALMEYIGPRPLYCAEHIPLDPDSFYNKCASTFHKAVGDGKGCREVVLKEFGFCHKHYTQAIDLLLDGTEEGWHKACSRYDRICFLLTQLETEAAAAKRSDPDLFQRKHKLIPKFMEMKKVLCKRLVEYESCHKHSSGDPNGGQKHFSPSRGVPDFDPSSLSAKKRQSTTGDYLCDDPSSHSNSVSSDDSMANFSSGILFDHPMMGYSSTQINSY